MELLLTLFDFFFLCQYCLTSKGFLYHFLENVLSLVNWCCCIMYSVFEVCVFLSDVIPVLQFMSSVEVMLSNLIPNSLGHRIIYIVKDYQVQLLTPHCQGHH